MPRGFVGRPATLYLSQVNDAHERAASETVYRPEGAPPTPNKRRLPFGLEDANIGRASSLGRGDSSNIAVSQDDYEMVSNMINRADEAMGECLYSVAAEIETLCQTAFIMPSTAPRCMNVSDNVKRSLGQFRSITEDSLIQLRRYVQAILAVGNGVH